jgi:cyclopropane fatty-acyl-phospholipid synthase-like methyltransferase
MKVQSIYTDERTQEKQFQVMIEYRRQHGLETLGLMTNQAWLDDPKRLIFTLSRYKFVSKMLQGCEEVLEVGCGDAFFSRVVIAEVKKLTAVDFDPAFVKDVNKRMSDKWPFECRVHDMLNGPVNGKFDGIYALDVLEHILPENEDRFIKNMASSLSTHGTMIIGIPSLESQAYASPISKEGHVNCKSQPDLKETMKKYFNNVFMFSMNDEVVHTGYHKMAHYIFALCCGRIQ